MKKIFEKVDKIIIGSVTIVISLILNFIWWIYSYDKLVPIWVVCLVIIVCYIVCVMFYSYFSTKSYETVYHLPKVKKIIKQERKIIFIVEENNLFREGSYATICYQNDENELENVIGLGYVQTINNKNNMQIEIIKTIGDEAKIILNEIKDIKNDKESIIIKPSIHKDLIEE